MIANIILFVVFLVDIWFLSLLLDRVARLKKERKNREFLEEVFGFSSGDTPKDRSDKAHDGLLGQACVLDVLTQGLKRAREQNHRPAIRAFNKVLKMEENRFRLAAQLAPHVNGHPVQDMWSMYTTLKP